MTPTGASNPSSHVSAKGPYISRIYVVNTDGTDERQLMKYTGSFDPCGLVDGICRGGALFHIDRGGTDLVWSPDGRSIAYNADGNIFVMNADGTDKRQLTEDGECFGLTWSPDGTRIAYMESLRHEYHEYELFVMTLASESNGTDSGS